MAVQFSSIKKYQTSVNDGTVAYSDNFDARSNASIVGQGNWVDVQSGSDIVVTGSGDKYLENTAVTDTTAAVMVSGTFSANQSAQITVKTLQGTTKGVGVMVRTSTSPTFNIYYYWVTGANGYLSVVSENVDYSIATSTHNYVAGDVIKLVVNGTSIKCYLNGSLDTNLGSATSPATGTGGDYVDSRLSSGNPGLLMQSKNTADVIQLDSFEAKVY